MKILLTGSSGYIGSSIAKRLIEKGFNVIAITNNNQLKFDAANLEIVKIDLLDKDSINGVFDGIDAVIHLAGQRLNKNATNDDYIRGNLILTDNILDACIEHNIKRFIFSSSMAVYGINAGWFDAAYLPVDEKHPIKPYEYYGLSKYLAENVTKFYHDRYSINSIILRYSRVYGIGARGFITQSIEKAMKNEDIIINGDISTDFVFLDDVVDATINALNLDGYHIFNIGNGREVRLSEIAEMITSSLDSKSRIIIKEKITSRFYYDISRAKRYLNYKPLDIAKGIELCIRHHISK